jgi:hypothetical protein
MVLAFGAGLPALGGEVQKEARHAGTRILTGGNMTVEVMDPAAEAPYYQGTRFTPVAAVLRAVAGALAPRCAGETQSLPRVARGRRRAGVPPLPLGEGRPALSEVEGGEGCYRCPSNC